MAITMTAAGAAHQLVHTLSYGDAISGEAFSLQRCLRKMGYESEIYAINVHPRYKGHAQDYRSFPTGFDGEVILHYSLGSPLNQLYLELTRATRGLIYHNLTPPRWFAGVNPRIVRDLDRGLEELPTLCAVTDRLIADSKFNAEELRQWGFNAEILHLPVDPKRWDFAANAGIASLVRAEGGIQLLHVGRFAPNKCIEDIIKTFYFVHHHLQKKSRLWLVGIDIDTELYSFALKRLARELELDSAVNFVGCLADSEVKALYENCTAYLCMSEHEGFCVPAIEAMSFGLPVIAYASSALPDTIGGGGLIVHQKRHPHIAELINYIYERQDFRNDLIARGRRRVEELSFENFERRLGELLSAQPARKAGNAVRG